MTPADSVPESADARPSKQEVELLARCAYEVLVHEPDAERARTMAKAILSHITRHQIPEHRHMEVGCWCESYPL